MRNTMLPAVCALTLAAAIGVAGGCASGASKQATGLEVAPVESGAVSFAAGDSLGRRVFTSKPAARAGDRPIDLASVEVDR